MSNPKPPMKLEVTSKSLETEDHRVRVGRERSEKMRRRLLTAMMATYARCKWPSMPVVEDLLKEAGVSRATFYAHFVSLEDAIDAVGQELAQEMLQNLYDLFKFDDDPLTRMVTGIEMFLIRAMMDPLWADFASRTEFLSDDSAVRKVVARDLNDARQQGVVEFAEIDAALSLFIGTMTQGIRHLVKTRQKSRAYVENVTIMMLRALGVGPEDARRIVNDRSLHIRGVAPEFLPWWRDPWPETA